MAHHHHHPQLTAHSQLTTLSPGQIHYIQLPATSVLPAASTIYQHDNRVLSTNFMRTAPGTNCLICLQSLSARTGRSSGGKKPVEIFNKICQLLQVSVGEIQHEWSFVHDEKLPFCSTCAEIIQGVIMLDEQIQTIQSELNENLTRIKRTIQDTVDRVPINDSRIINFRSRVLKHGNLVVTSRHNNGHYGINASNVAPDMTNPLAPTSNLVIQQESSFRQQNLLPMTSAISYQTLQYSLTTPLHPLTAQKPTTFSSSNGAFNSTIPNSESNRLLTPNHVYIEQASNTSNFEEGSNSYFEDGGDFVSQSDSEKSFESSDKNNCEDVMLPKNTGKRATKGTKKQRRTKVINSDMPKNDTKRQCNEYFAPVETDEQGRTTFEGIVIKLGESSYICGQCGASCGKGHDKASMRKIKIHIKGFHLAAYKCNVCDKNFTSNDILSQHIVRTHQLADVPCDICLRPVKPRYIDTHKFTHMNAEEKVAFIAAGFKPPQNRELQRRFECTTCGKMFKKRPVLRRHESSHVNVEFRKHYKCGTCNRSYTTDQALKEHVLTHHDAAGNVRKKMCKVCGKVMFAKALRKHVRTHIPKEDRPYVCKICGARLLNRKSLQMHESAHDPNETSAAFNEECDVCGKMFKTSVSMRNHRRKTHRNHWKLAIPSKLITDVSIDQPGEDGYLDDLNNEGLQIIEGQLFSYQLYQVKRIEEPSTGYRCCTCLKEFVGVDDDVEEQVKTHIRSEHIGNFRCNICTKRMKNIQEVLAHKRSDHMHCVDLTCEVCKKPNIGLKGYKSHVWLHKNPYEVADAINAGETFPHNYVSEHQRVLVELGVQLSFSCVICDAKHERVEHLHQHRIAVHPDAPKLRIKRKLVENKRGRKPKLVTDVQNIIMGKKGSQSSIARSSKRELTSKIERVTTLSKVNVKEEILSDSNSDTDNGDFDNNELEYKHASQLFDQDLKVPAHVDNSAGVTLRRSTRNRKNVCEETTKNRTSVPFPIDGESSQKANGKFKVEYIFPEEEFNELLLSEGDIKQSPKSSDVDSDSCGD